MTRSQPVSTYRVQLRGDVDLSTAAAHVSDLRALGVDWLYVSPLLRAAEGSDHGYDVIDPEVIDPALGGEAGLHRLTRALAEADMGLLLDIVPNHVRASIDNPWWRDQLEHGPASRYAGFFDIRWSVDPQARVVLPVLECHYGEALEGGLLRLGVDDQGLLVGYRARAFPLDPRTWPLVLERLTGSPALERLCAACTALPPRVDTRAARQRRIEHTPILRTRLAALLRERPGLGEAIADAPDGATPSERHDALHAVLEAQSYRLAYWRSGLDELNYRRFFDINELVALRMERTAVFDAYHRRVLELVAQGEVQGLRIDHVDGLACPRVYLERLRTRGVRYVVVEKILQRGEQLPPSWLADGTTGYDFIDAVGPLLCDPLGWAVLDAAFRCATGHTSFSACVQQSKRDVLARTLAPALRTMAADLRELAAMDRRARDVSFQELHRALTALTAALPVYRIYSEAGPHGNSSLVEDERERFELALREARAQLSAAFHCALDFIARVVEGRVAVPPGQDGRASAFVRRWQQLTGPTTAKGVEDTALYRYVTNLGLAEVGCTPVPPDDPEAAFTAWAVCRRERAPRGLLALSTHDTKRGADVRARLYVLTERPDDYLHCLTLCEEGLGIAADDSDRREELELLVQTVIGALPPWQAERERFDERLHPYLVKAAREAKRRTSWIRPDPEAEAEIVERARTLLGSLSSTAWGRALDRLHQQVAIPGAINGLAQLVLQLVSPGVCDVYQGTERWDLSLVDPDNRRPVDFARLRDQACELHARWSEDRGALLHELRERWHDGRIKTHVLMRGLADRRSRPGPYLEGRVVPLELASTGADQHAHALARCCGDAWVMGVVARRASGLVGDPPRWPLRERWRGTAVALPPDAPRRWYELLSGRTIHATNGTLLGPELFAELPVALLRARARAGS
ncbi:malto-oligosyltrehalose synthase [Paraliomyxa miuraensis]|uniref:malto-oligosyltrehalose synthase n=1 Tax=Paraliomyxa miuraensis TaxID=376150 RepID=UPI002251B531|nr:malto-oligosyltrehalose synthase [Paraliomyxa miuraensis]MCX4241035.1 malto-oligosyltrehalose synthase [Paraliomyxa miuraensis]